MNDEVWTKERSMRYVTAKRVAQESTYLVGLNLRLAALLTLNHDAIVLHRFRNQECWIGSGNTHEKERDSRNDSRAFNTIAINTYPWGARFRTCAADAESGLLS